MIKVYPQSKQLFPQAPMFSKVGILLATQGRKRAMERY